MQSTIKLINKTKPSIQFMCIVIKVFSNKVFKVSFKSNHHTDKQTCYVFVNNTCSNTECPPTKCRCSGHRQLNTELLCHSSQSKLASFCFHYTCRLIQYICMHHYLIQVQLRHIQLCGWICENAMQQHKPKYVT